MLHYLLILPLRTPSLIHPPVHPYRPISLPTDIDRWACTMFCSSYRPTAITTPPSIPPSYPSYPSYPSLHVCSQSLDEAAAPPRRRRPGIDSLCRLLLAPEATTEGSHVSRTFGRPSPGAVRGLFPESPLSFSLVFAALCACRGAGVCHRVASTPPGSRRSQRVR